MATDNKDICNLALDNLGVTNKITTLADQTKEARACARWYEHVGQYILRKFPWPFAAHVAELVLVEGIEHPEWYYVYQLPEHFLKLRRIFVPGQLRNERPKPGGLITLEDDDGVASTYLGCDHDQALAEYTLKMVLADATGDAFVPKLPPEFVEAFSWKLAARLVTPLALDKGLIGDAERMYAITVADAFSISAEEITLDEPMDAEHIRARG